jgi:hypothetical protein
MAACGYGIAQQRERRLRLLRSTSLNSHGSLNTLSQNNHWEDNVNGKRWSLAGQTVPKTTELNQPAAPPSRRGEHYMPPSAAGTPGPGRLHRGELATSTWRATVVVRILVNGVDVTRNRSTATPELHGLRPSARMTASTL